MPGAFATVMQASSQANVETDTSSDVIPSTSRIEAFSDGVIAIALTILVLELKIPELSRQFSEQQVQHVLVETLPKLASYFLSFLIIAIYWVNHHHMFHLLEKADSGLLWLNNNLLLWLSLLAFPTALLGEHPESHTIAALYGAVSMMTAVAFLFLHRHAYRKGLFSSTYSAQAFRSDAMANYMTLGIYLIMIAMSFYKPLIAELGYAAIALLYFVPRIKAR